MSEAEARKFSNPTRNPKVERDSAAPWSEDYSSPAEEQGSEVKYQTVAYSCPVDHAGMTLYVKGWVNSEPSLFPPVIVIHDIGETVSQYREFCTRLVETGCNVYCYDLRGHGRSGRIIGQINRFGELVNDLLQVSAWVKHKENSQAPILVGHGVSAQLAMRFAQNYPKLIQGVALISPGFKLKVEASRWWRLLARVMYEFSPSIRLSCSWLHWLDNGTNKGPEMTAQQRQLSSNFHVSSYFLQEMGLSFGHSILGEAPTTPVMMVVPSESGVYDFDNLSECLPNSWASSDCIRVQSEHHRMSVNGSEHVERISELLLSWMGHLAQPQKR
jgi:pimeloyl-ACP methyl ester carboxylesterase